MSPNTRLRASKVVCFGHARSRCTAMAMNERRSEQNTSRSRGKYGLAYVIFPRRPDANTLLYQSLVSSSLVYFQAMTNQHPCLFPDDREESSALVGGPNATSV